MKKLYVGNLPYSTDDEQLKALFDKFGTVSYSRVITDRDTNRSRGFGFVELPDGPATVAIQEMNGHEINGRPLRVNEAQEKQSGGGRGGGGHGGHGHGGGHR